MSTHRTDVSSKALDYIKEVFTHETPEMAAIAKTLTKQEKVMQISAIEAQILKVIIALAQVKTVIEVGTLVGYSAVNMAKILPKDGRIYAIDRSTDCMSRAKENAKNCGVLDKIEFCQGDALAILETLSAKGPFDMIFIDADKANYTKYLDWAEHNIRKGGVIVGDNTLLFGHVYEPTCPPEGSKNAYDAMREFNKRLGDPKKYTSIMIPTVEGLTVAIKR